MPVRVPRCDASIAIILLGLLVAFALLSPISTRFESARRLNEPEAFTTQYALARFDGRLQGQVNTGYGELPFSFQMNCGQTDPQVKFLSRGGGYSLFLTSTETVLLKNSGRSTPEQVVSNEIAENRRSDILRMKLIGANSAPRVQGIHELPGKSNYFIGSDPRKWRANVPTYAKVKYENVYPGIDVIYYGNQHQLEYDLVVAPGAKPGVIRLGFEGVDKLSLDEQNDLLLHTAFGEIRQGKPLIYQEKYGIRQEIAGRYVISLQKEVSFEVAAYDATRSLIIDPVLSYSTYLGGSGMEQGQSIAVDSVGNTYVTGFTASTNFPTANPLQANFGGSPNDVFIVKLNPAGSAIVYSTYLGGSGNDVGNGIAVDSSGNAYVTGFTNSVNFPTMNPLQAALGDGSGDAFVTKLNPTGSGLIYSTFLGGSRSDQAFGITTDPFSNAYVIGETESSDFPVASPLQAANSGGLDAFIAKLSPTGSALAYSTYLGGSETDRGRSISVDSAGSVYATGGTGSSDFPTTSGAFQRTFGGSFDVFVTKLNTTGSALLYSTYIGGSNADIGLGIAVDSAGNACVTGGTDSNNFPTTPGAFQRAFGGGNAFGGDAFIGKLNAEGSALLYSSYLGGSGADQGASVAVDLQSKAYVTGRTSSSDFPTANQIQSRLGGGFSDGFVAEVSTTGSALLQSTYLGGSDFDVGAGIAVDSSGNAYVTGSTSSADFPLLNPFQSALGSTLSDAFVAKIGTSDSGGNAPSLTSILIFRKKSSVDHLIAGVKTKKYSLVLTGSGFIPSAHVLVNGSEVETSFTNGSELTAGLPPGRVPGPGFMTVQARNGNGPVSNILTIEVRND
jgi:hypothetical protein